MKYLIIGVGGVGGTLAYFMTKGGLDVTCLMRGEGLKAVKENGLRLVKPCGDEQTVFPSVTDEQSIDFSPDVIFVCVKSYSLSSVIPVLRKISNNNTVIIPLLNVPSTGKTIQGKIENCLVTDGCVYVSSNITAPGEITMHGDIFRVVFGRRDGKPDDRLAMVDSDLKRCNILSIYSSDIRKDAFQKFIYVSTQALCGLYYDVDAGDIQSKPEIRADFESLLRECVTLGEAMGIYYKDDQVKRNMDILDDLLPGASTSMQRDIRLGKKSEIEQLIFDVVEQGKNLGVDMPVHIKMAKGVERYR